MTRKFTFSALVAAILAASPVAAQTAESNPVPQLTMEHHTLLRCSVVFAMIAGGQENGVEEALAYPPMEERGKEYFVRALAQVMQDTGMSRQQIFDAIKMETKAIAQSDNRDTIIDVCLQSLNQAKM
ncbi:hypothetical protein [Altericroceibacterium endophyticum]|uniref:Uncharacterized protein n=1 Tax=Altericroceibacterium endophyticum TaxID=1808508 RepID=A0A6I4T4N1_9SPHN|nr:hypothetical protein [Altericroceibacterium endophyticum]MXO65172.1 hypothetical protein [Altericroceibacterium endophyticum]